MKYSEFKAGVMEMLLEDGEIHGAEAYYERQIRLSLLKALTFFPTLRPDATLNVASREVIIDGKACEVGIPNGATITEIRVIPSGWGFLTGPKIATTNGGGLLAFEGDFVSAGDALVLNESGGTGWDTEALMYVVNDGAGNLGLARTMGGARLYEEDIMGSTLTYRRITPVTSEPQDRLGPLEFIPWSDRYTLINGLVAPCDLKYAVSPDRDRIVVHPIIDFEKILQISYRSLGTKFTDDNLIHVPEALEDHFISTCADYVRSRLAKDIDRNASMAAINFAEFKQGLKTIFRELPR